MWARTQRIEGSLSVMVQHGEEYVRVFVYKDEYGRTHVVVKEWTMGSQDEIDYPLEER